MPKARCGAILALLTLFAGCTGAGSETDDQSLQAASVVRAFANLCGRLEAPEVARRAASLGFRPVDPARLPPQTTANLPTDGSVQVFARPSPAPGEAGAILAWNGRGPVCEMAVVRVTPAAVERAFDSMIATLSTRPGIQVQVGQIRGAPPTDAAGLTLRRAAVMIAQAGEAGQPAAVPQAVMLRTATQPVPDGQVQAILSIHLAQRQPAGAGSATPPPAPAQGR